MEITIHNESKVKAEGKQRNACAKPVFCIDTGEVYSSVIDAAKAIGVHSSTMSWALTGRQQTCKGKRYCYVANITEHLDEIAEKMRVRETKVRAYDEILYAQEALQRATENYESRKAKVEKIKQMLEKEIELLEQAELELNNLKLKEAM